MAYKRISPIPIAEGGTNATAMATTDGVVYFDGTSLLTTAVGSAAQVLTSNGAGVAPTYQAIPASSISITGNTGGALTGTSFTFTGGTTGLTFAGSGTTETVGGTLAIANGGTNATSMATTDGVVYFDGTRLVTTAAGSVAQVLTSNGAGVAPTYQAIPGGILTATKTLTSTQVKSLHGTPIAFISAPAANFFIGILSVFVRLNYGGTNPFSATVTQGIKLQYKDGTGIGATSNFISGSNLSSSVTGTIYTSGAGSTAFSSFNISAQPIVLYNSDASEITGNAANDNTVDVLATYQILPY